MGIFVIVKGFVMTNVCSVPLPQELKMCLLKILFGARDDDYSLINYVLFVL